MNATARAFNFVKDSALPSESRCFPSHAFLHADREWPRIDLSDRTFAPVRSKIAFPFAAWDSRRVIDGIRAAL